MTNLKFVMIKIEAVIRSSVLHQVQDSLAAVGIPTFSHIKSKSQEFIKLMRDGEIRQVILFLK